MADPRPWRMLLPLFAVLVLFALWSAYWWVADGYAHATFDAQRARFAAQGLTLACANESWGGYPFRFEYECAAPVLTAAGQAEAKARHALAVAQAYNPTHIVILLDGPSTVTAFGRPPVTISHDAAVVSLRVKGARQVEIEADIPKAAITGLAQSEDLQLFARPGAQAGTVDVAGRIKTLNATLPNLPPISLDAAQVIATLDQPNHAQVTDLSASRGDLRVWATGEAGLDGERRPAGALTVATNDLKGLMAALDPYLTLTDKQRSGLSMLVAFMGKDAKTMVRADNGELFVGPLKLGRLAPLF